MATVGTITVDLKFKITLWQAIKLRIAGKGVASRLVDEFIVARLKEAQKEVVPSEGEMVQNWGGLKTEDGVGVKGVKNDPPYVPLKTPGVVSKDEMREILGEIP